jgi:hypothetical protein
MNRTIRKIIRTAGLRDKLTFTSFRHGGFTEGADADLSDAELRAQGRRKSSKVLPEYAKQTMRRSRREPKSGVWNEQKSDICQNEQHSCQKVGSQ